MSKLYKSQDMVKISCSACAGCGDCCHEMGDTIHLDPYDVYQLTQNLHHPFSELLEWKIKLRVDQGMILPSLKMDERTRACSFLSEEGTCTIHAFRPGICRLFPLGRNYDNHSFQYFIVEDGCTMPGKSKIKISKWLGIPNLLEYEKFVATWHYFVKDVQQKIAEVKEEERRKEMNMLVLQTFFMAPYDDSEQDFFQIFEERKKQIEKIL